MGTIIHNAIIVSTLHYDGRNLSGKARRKAVKLFGLDLVTMPRKTMNGWYHFFILPDSGKAGWEQNDNQVNLRKKFLDWLEKQVCEFGVCLYRAVSVNYGDTDDDLAHIDREVRPIDES